VADNDVMTTVLLLLTLPPSPRLLASPG
jgi:hypothetical protein